MFTTSRHLVNVFCNDKGNVKRKAVRRYKHDVNKGSVTQYVHDKGKVKKGSITRGKHDVNRAPATRIKHDVNEKLVPQYVHNKGKAPRIDGTLDISGHIPMIVGRNYEMYRDYQSETKVINNKGG